MKQIHVEKEKCIGCGACVAIAQENFAFDDDGKSSVISNEGLENEAVTNAIESCPTVAISIIESEEERTEEPCNCHECEEEECHCEHCHHECVEEMEDEEKAA